MKFSRVYLGMGLGLCITGSVLAQTINDDNKAGVQFYQSKNYTQALQSFDTALKLDSNNMTALEGRAYSYGALGQYSNALNDAQKALSLNPSNTRWAQFVDRLKLKVASLPAAPPAALPPALTAVSASTPPISTNSLDQGFGFYQQKQYESALPYFQQAIQQNPTDWKGFYYLGMSQYALGDKKNGVLNLTLANQKQPNDSLKSYLDQLMVQLSPEDQKSIDHQVKASPVTDLQTLSGQAALFGMRFHSQIVLNNFSDYLAETNTEAALVKANQSVDPTLNYNASAPTLGFSYTLEPVMEITPNVELGFEFGLLSIGQFQETIDNGDHSAYSSLTIDNRVFSFGLNGRYFFLQGPFRPFVGLGMALYTVDLNYNLNNGTGSSATNLNADFSNLIFGGQVQAGMDCQLGGGLVLTPEFGYRLAQGNNFRGAFQGNGSQYGTIPPGTPGQLDVYNSPYGPQLIYFPNNPQQYGINPSQYPGLRSAQFDFGGFEAGISLGVFF